MSALARSVLAFCGAQGVVLPGKTVLCALSGGRDSMALLHVMLRLGEREGFAVAAAHYNHNLRETAQRDEKFVRGWCASKGIPLTVGGGDVRAFAREQGASVEDAARTLRYRFLEETARELGADFIATAHHREDNAETILLHLLRGAGLQGLCGIPPVRGRVIRPLLDASRADINDYIEKNALPYVEDETNADTAYARNRLRHELLPLLEELSRGSVGRIAGAGARLRADNGYLERLAAALLPPAGENGETSLPTALLRGEDPAVAARVVRLGARRLGTELTAAQMDAVMALRPGGTVTLSGGVRAVCEGKAVRLCRLSPPPPPLTLQMGRQQWGKWRVTVAKAEKPAAEDEHTVVLRADAPALTIAAWDGTGRLAVENGRRTVKRLLLDHGVTPARQENRPAVFAGGELAAVFGAGVDRAFQCASGEKQIVITLECEDNSHSL